jgi:hypothetical protein
MMQGSNRRNESMEESYKCLKEVLDNVKRLKMGDGEVEKNEEEVGERFDL